MEKLLQRDEAEWGKTATVYAFERKRLLRQIMRERRARYLLNNVPVVERKRVERGRQSGRIVMRRGEKVFEVAIGEQIIPLPYVTFQHI